MPASLRLPCLTRHRVVFGKTLVSEGEKGACDQAPEASADLPDFPPHPLSLQQASHWITGGWEGLALAPRSHGGTSTS